MYHYTNSSLCQFWETIQLHTDASVLGLGAVLYQEQDGVEKVISYASGSLSKSESKYPIHKMEFLCLKWAITVQFHKYLYGNTFDVYTDNNPLTYVLSTAKLGGSLVWLTTIFISITNQGKVMCKLMPCQGLIGRNVMRPFRQIQFRQ